MTSIEYIEIMIQLTHKKSEAFLYLLDLLKNKQVGGDIYFKQWYFNRKRKIEQAILKVDIEFLDAYQKLLNQENVNAIGELPKEKFIRIKSLQSVISETKALEEQIKIGEQQLLSMNESPESLSYQKPSKHTAPRAIEAYKKFKK